MSRKRWLAAAVAVLAAADLALLTSGWRILVHESRLGIPLRFDVVFGSPQPRIERYVMACRYFTGRSILTTAFAYDPQGLKGIDECPFTYKP